MRCHNRCHGQNYSLERSDYTGKVRERLNIFNVIRSDEIIMQQVHPLASPKAERRRTFPKRLCRLIIVVCITIAVAAIVLAVLYLTNVLEKDVAGKQAKVNRNVQPGIDETQVETSGRNNVQLPRSNGSQIHSAATFTDITTKTTRWSKSRQASTAVVESSIIPTTQTVAPIVTSALGTSRSNEVKVRINGTRTVETSGTNNVQLTRNNGSQTQPATVSPTSTTKTENSRRTRKHEVSPGATFTDKTTTATQWLKSRQVSAPVVESSITPTTQTVATIVTPILVKWSRWSSFSKCSQTCGGGRQVRTRTCDVIQGRVASGQEVPTCAGKPQQNRTCAEWSCPDCNKTCSQGTLNPTCDACTCNDHTLTGRVLTKDGTPLSDASISLADTPYKVLAQTDSSGNFRAFNVCAEVQATIIKKDGFVTANITTSVKSATAAVLSAKLEFAVPPSVTVDPASKMRISGQSVTFCCKGQGHPPPNIEWFRNGNILDTELSENEGTLHIADVRGMNGSYQCRTVNDYGAEFSDVAVLTVLDSIKDTCNPVPRTKNVTLPESCVVEGTDVSTVDVGECKPAPCLRNDSTISTSCKDHSRCCSPKMYAQVKIQCARDMQFNMSRVIQCGCDEKCTEQKAYLRGRVVGPDGRPMEYGDIMSGGKKITYTDWDGHFSVEVPENKRRMAITFVDAHEELESVTKVFTIQEGQINFYKIVLPRREPPVSFNASEPIDIPVGHSSENQSSFAEVEIPANSLLSEDGTPFTGQANVRMSVTDPRNETDVQLAPGDFTAVDEDGEQQMLQTFGMIKMNFEDENKKPLAMSKPMKIFIDPEQVNMTVDQNGNVSAKLYWLDDQTGRWREAGNIWAEDGSSRRRKRDTRIFIVAEVLPQMSKQTLNFDIGWTEVAVRVKAEPQSTVRIIRADNGGYVEKVTNKKGIACVPVWSDTDCYMQVEKDGELLEPTLVFGYPEEINASIVLGPEGTGIKSLRFHSSISGGNGPIYGIAEKALCRMLENGLNEPEQTHFLFLRPGDASLTDKYRPTRIIRNPSSWNAVYRNNKRCYIKIKILANHNSSFVVESFKENDWGESYGATIGTSIQTADPNVYVLCLEYRCGRPPRRGQAEEPTFVIVSPLTGTCKPFDDTTDMDSGLKAGQSHDDCKNASQKSKEQVVSFCARAEDGSNFNSYGTYIGDYSNGEDHAWKGCLISQNEATPSVIDAVQPWYDNIKSDKYSLLYDCRPHPHYGIWLPW